MPVGDLLPEIWILLAAVAIVLCAGFLPQARQPACAAIAVAGLLAAGITAVLQLGAPARTTFSGVWSLDGAAIWAKLLIVTTTGLVVLLSPEWFSRDRRHGEYYAVLLFGTLGAVFMASAADTMQLVVGVLLSSIAGYTLAAWHRGWPLSVEAGMKFFVVGAFANALLLIGVTWLFGLSGSTDYRIIADAASSGATQPAWTAALSLIVIGLAFKLGAVPAHAWMPDVAQGAPAPSAAFLTVVPKIGAAVALARTAELAGGDLPAWRLLVAIIAVATMTLGNLAALRQEDLRRLLGWSSVSQSGFALVAAAMIGVSVDAAAALIFFLAAYAVANVAAFAAVTELRGRTALAGYAGLASAQPAIAGILAVALLSLIGIPPLAGFVGKFMIFFTAIEGDMAWLAVVAVANTIVSVFYYLRVIGPMYLDEAGGRVATLGRMAAVAMWLSAASIPVLGIGAQPLLAALRRIVLLP
jgi:NADH-quinone oxidoreductase subunit N